MVVISIIVIMMVVIAIVMIVVVMTVVVVVFTMLVLTVVSMLVLVDAIVLTRPLDLVGPGQLLLTTALELRPTQVFRGVLAGAHEINRSIAGMVLVAMPPPVVRVLGRNVQIQRLDYNTGRRRLDGHRLRVQHRRRRTATQVDATVNTRGDFSPDGKTDIQVTGVRQRAQRAVRNGQQGQTSQHITHRRSPRLGRRTNGPTDTQRSKEVAR
jgi:hypothetical protein